MICKRVPCVLESGFAAENPKGAPDSEAFLDLEHLSHLCQAARVCSSSFFTSNLTVVAPLSTTYSALPFLPTQHQTIHIRH
jgi:hypothetical protein